MNTFISKKTGRLAVSSFFLLITLLLTFAADLIIAPHVSGADGDTSLTVNIDYPPDGVEICYCSNFNVGVTIINTGGQIAVNTIAWIEIIGNASLVSGETVQKGPVDLGTENWYPWWTLHCDGAGDVTIVVHTQADNAPEQTDSVTISQLKPHLVVDITTPQDGTSYPAGSTFDVIAQVQNTGTLLAQYVSLSISLSGPASTSDNVTKSATPQHINPGETATAKWSVQCQQPGEVTITVNGSGWYYCEEEEEQAIGEHTEGATFNQLTPIPHDNIEPATITVYQGEPNLAVTFTSPQNGSTIEPGNDFCVIASATNNGVSTAYGSTLTIAINGPASTASSLTKNTNPPDIGAGSSGCAAWSMLCTGEGDVIITVTPAGYMDHAHTAAISAGNLTPRTITVHQRAPRGADSSFSSPASQAGEQMTPTGTRPFVLNMYVRPYHVVANQPVTVYGNMTNRGDVARVYTIALKVNGEIEQVKEGNLAPHTAVPLEFEVYRSEPGLYNIDLDGKTASFYVVDNTATGQSRQPFTVRGILIILFTMLFTAVIVVAIVVYRRLV